MTALVPLLAAVGALLVYQGLTQRAPSGSKLSSFLRRLVVEAGLGDRSPRQVLGSCVGSGIAALVIGAAVTQSSIVIAIAFVFGVTVPIGWLRSRARKRRISHREVWPEAIALLISGVRAGLSLPEVVAALADRGPEVLRPHFDRYRVTYRSTASFPAALDSLARDLADPVGDRVVAALLLAHEVGGSDLVRVLRTLGDFVSDDLRVRKEVEARWAWTVSAAKLAAAAPWIVLLVMAARPEAAAAYDSPGGTMLVLCGAAATFVGYRLMLRAARLPEEARWRR